MARLPPVICNSNSTEYESTANPARIGGGSDVSARVDLAREMQSSQNQAQAQVDTLLGILHVPDPTQLASFLNDSNAAMR